MTNSKKILFADFIRETDVGGGQLILLDFVEAVKNKNYSYYSLCLSDGILKDRWRQSSATLLDFTVDKRFLSFTRENVSKNFVNLVIEAFLFIPYIFKFSKFLRIKKIALIHADGVTPFMIMCIPARLAKIPVIFHAHDIVTSSFARFLVRTMALIFSTKVIAVSRKVAEMFESGTMNNDKTVLIYNGVDHSKFQPRKHNDYLTKEFDVGNSIIIGSFGSLVREKGQILLLKAFKVVFERYRDIKLLVVGSGPYEKAIKSYARQLGIADGVIFTGFRSDVANIMSFVDIVVQPSILPEACPMVVLESMSTAKPVICFNVGSISELIQDDVTGMLVEKGNCQQMAEVIVELLNSNEKRVNLGLNARKSVLQRFRRDQSFMKIEALYENLLCRSNAKVTNS